MMTMCLGFTLSEISTTAELAPIIRNQQSRNLNVKTNNGSMTDNLTYGAVVHCLPVQLKNGSRNMVQYCPRIFNCEEWIRRRGAPTLNFSQIFRIYPWDYAILGSSLGFKYSGRSRISQTGGTRILFDQLFPENCIKIKEIGHWRNVHPWRPLGSANGLGMSEM